MSDHAFTLLNRLAERVPENQRWLERAVEGNRLKAYSETAFDVVRETLGPLGSVLAQAVMLSEDLEPALELMSLSVGDDQQMSISLIKVALAATERVANDYREICGQEPPEIQHATRSMLAHNRAVWLGRLGRYAEASLAEDEAIEGYQTLVDLGSPGAEQELAGCLEGQSRWLDAQERWGEALVAGTRAQELRRLQCEQGGGASSELELARCLLSVSKVQLSLGHRLEALKVAEEAHAIFSRRLGDQLATARSELCRSQNHLGLVLRELGRFSEARQHVEAANELRRELAIVRPDVFLPELANGLEIVASILDEEGNSRRALALNKESVEIRRVLAEDLPERYGPDLARSLARHSFYLAALDQRDEAVVVCRRALGLLRASSERQQAEPSLDQMTIAGNLAEQLRKLGQADEALGFIQETITHLEGLAERHPERGRPELAAACAILGSILMSLGRYSEAVAAGERAAGLRRALAAETPKAFAGELGQGLVYLAFSRHHHGDIAGALRAVDEALGWYAVAAEESPARFLVAKATAMCQRAVYCSELGGGAEALEAGRQALAQLRSIRETQGVSVGALAEAVNNLGVLLSRNGARAEACELFGEAVAMYRELATRWPRAFAGSLVASLDNHAGELEALGRLKDAFAASEEALRGLLERHRGHAGLEPTRAQAILRRYLSIQVMLQENQ